MGGWGSGRQGGRVTIEGCGSLRLSISDLRDLMHDPPGTARWIQYSQNGEHRMTVVVEVRASHGYVRLQHPSRASDRTEHMDYTVGLIWTVPRLAAAAGGSPARSRAAVAECSTCPGAPANSPAPRATGWTTP